MTIQVVEATTFGTASAKAAIQRPSLLQDGDFALMSIQWMQGVSMTVEPNRWTLITATATSTPPAFNDIGMKLYWLHASSEPASYSATFSALDNYSYQIIVLRGQLGSTTAVDSPANLLIGTATPSVVTVPACTISSTASLRVAFLAQVGNAGSSPSHFEDATNWTSRIQRTAVTVANAIFTKQVTGSGVDAAVNFSISDFAGGGLWIATSVAIRADPAFTVTASTIPHIGSMSLLGVGR